MISSSFLLKRLNFDAKRGRLTWRPTGDKAWDTRFAGAEAGSINKAGYRQICITMPSGKVLRVYSHRVIFALSHGYWPRLIDHINRNTLDNRPTNLRDATKRVNAKNTGLRCDNKSGFKGVYFEAKTKKWRASYKSPSKLHQIGRYHSAEEANTARLKFITKLKGDLCENCF